MRKILIRASVAPWAEYTPLDVINDKIIGNNTGNLLFASSVTRLLYTEDTEIDFLPDKDLVANKITPEYINETYEQLILPMANAFREDFVNKCLKKWTALIKKLKIPVVVVGIGVQMKYEPNLDCKRVFDDAVKDFIGAVLEHSNSVGVRGEITKAYLNRMGFRQIDVIGCPSLAMFGPELPVRDKVPLTAQSAVCFTGSVSNPVNFKEFALRNREILPNYYFMPQFIDDLKLLYLGIPLPDTPNARTLYPHTIDDQVFLEDKARFFINLPSILEFNQKIDFNYGTRIHGAIGNILCGVPSLLFPTDARVRELAEYHNIPGMPAHLVDENTNILELYENTDFSQVNQGHAQRFWHLIDFLKDNGVPNIYQNRTAVPSTSLMDKKLEGVRFEGPVRSILTCPPDEIARRMVIAQKLKAKETAESERKAAEKLKTANQEIAALQKDVAKLQNKEKRLKWYENTSTFHIGKSRLKKKIKRWFKGSAK